MSGDLRAEHLSFNYAFTLAHINYHIMPYCQTTINITLSLYYVIAMPSDWFSEPPEDDFKEC